MDVLVIGFGITGVSAALSCASAGNKVYLIEYLADSYALDDHFLVNTPLFAGPMRGHLFFDAVKRELESAGVRTRYDVAGLNLVPKRIIHERLNRKLRVHDDFMEQTLSVDRVVLSPSGTEPGMPPSLGSSAFIGRGLSYSAYSDGSYASGGTSLVIGCDYHAYEQAHILEEFGHQCSIICSGNSGPDPFSSVSHNINVVDNTEVERILSTDGRSVSGLLLSRDGRRFSIDSKHVFVAHAPQVDLSAIEPNVGALIRQGHVLLGGIAAGVSYTDHVGLFEDGQRLAASLI